MENNTKGSYFWTSYSDLMTSLFFIMLVLFVLMIALLYQQVRITQRERDLIKNRLQEIEQIIESTKNLDKKYFRYEAAYKKYVLNIAVSFPTGESRIDKLQDPESLGKLREAGHAIQQFLAQNDTTQYLLIIEGQASRDQYQRNYELSYERALGLLRYWAEESPLKGNPLGRNCEILIAGSGDNTIETGAWREQGDEAKNQRFLIYLLPKNIIPEKDHEIH